MNRARVSLLGQAVRLTIGLAFALSFTVKANAQWLPDRAYSEGPGIRVGELELHPGIAIRGGYDTNVFRSDGRTVVVDDNGQPRELGQKITGGAILSVTPHLYLSTETSQRAMQGEDKPAATPRFLAFRGGVAASYMHYFLDNAPRNVAIDTDVFLAVAQGRPVELNVGAGYIRSISPFTERAPDRLNNEDFGAKERRNAYAFNTFDGSLRLKFNSRAQVLTGYLGYAPRFTHYESRLFDYLNNIIHGGEIGAAWRFLPSTALVYDGAYKYQDYLNNPTANQTPNLVIISNAHIVRSRLGINGALTNNLTLRVMAGYTAGFYNNRELDDFEDVIGEAVLGYRFFTHSFELGYRRDVQPSALGSWFRTDRGFARLGFLFARRFSVNLEGGVAYANYGRLIRVDNVNTGAVVGMGVGGDETRDDIRVDGALRAEYRATNWLSFMADFIVQSVITDFEFDLTASQTALLADPAKFNAMQVFAGVRAHY